MAAIDFNTMMRVSKCRILWFRHESITR